MAVTLKYIENRYIASALILLTLVLVLGSLSNILSDKRSDLDRIFDGNGDGRVTAGGSHNLFQIECNTPSECGDFLALIDSLKEPISDPQYNLFLNAISETITLYNSGEHTSWSAVTNFNLNEESASLSNIISMTITSSTDGAAHISLSADYNHQIPTILESSLQEFASNSESFLNYIEDREQYIFSLESNRVESSQTRFERFMKLMRALSKRTISLILFLAGTMTAIYGSYVIVSIVILKRKEEGLSIERGMTALAISLPVLLALSST